jgi:hypothetical protein
MTELIFFKIQNKVIRNKIIIFAAELKQIKTKGKNKLLKTKEKANYLKTKKLLY